MTDTEIREGLALGELTTVNKSSLEKFIEELKLLRRQRDYLIKHASIPARIVHTEFDPAGNTTEYEADKEAVELFGEDSLVFYVGIGSYPTCYKLNIKN